MREILFRGKCTGSGEWIYGNLNFYPDINRAFIRLWPGENKRTDTLETEVYKETVGQYTGICDKNGRKIFEGDVVVIRDGGIVRNYAVEYEEGNTAYYATDCDKKVIGFKRLVDENSDEYEVVGNIYDNPKLLRGGEG